MNTPSTKVRLTRPDGTVMGVVKLTEDQRINLIGGLQQQIMALALEQGIQMEGPWPNIEVVGPAVAMTMDRLGGTLESCIELLQEAVCNNKAPGQKMSEMRASAYELIEQIEEDLCELGMTEKLIKHDNECIGELGRSCFDEPDDMTYADEPIPMQANA